MKEGHALAGVQYEFMTLLLKHKNGAKIIQEYEKMVNEKCTGKMNVVSQIEMMSGPLTSKLPECYTCLFNILGKLSKSNGLTKQWTEVESTAQKHLDALKKCLTLANEDEINS